MEADIQQSIDELKDLLEGLGDWAQKIVLTGGAAALVYAIRDSVEPPKILPTYTEDVDLVLPAPSKITIEGELNSTLTNLNYRPEIKALAPGGEARQKWVKKEFTHYLEFLVGDKKGGLHTAYGVQAQGLAYLLMSYKNKEEFTIDGIKGTVVKPQAFIAHKVLTYPKRTKDEKRFKDIYYVVYAYQNVLSVEQRPELLRSLEGFYPSWKDTFVKNAREVLNWDENKLLRIAANDDSGEIVAAQIRQTCKALAELEL